MRVQGSDATHSRIQVSGKNVTVEVRWRRTRRVPEEGDWGWYVPFLDGGRLLSSLYTFRAKAAAAESKR